MPGTQANAEVRATAATGFAGMRIGLVGPLAPASGGMANQTRQLAELLHGAGAVVELVQTNSRYRPAWVGSLPMVRALFRLAWYIVALWRTAARSDIFHVMANSGWAWHLFSAPAIWVARLRHVPVVVNYRGGEAAAFLARSQALVRWTMKRAAILAVPSGFLEQVFRRYGMRAQVVPNVVDLARFHPREAGAESTAHVVVARSLEPIYDNATALRAFASVRQRVPHASLTIAGIGPDAARLRALRDDLGLGTSVCFAGSLDRDAMAALYRCADVCLNPSLADNMPNSVLEAMASGVPVVSTRVGGVPYIVQDGVTALLVPPRDAEAMAAAVTKLLQDPLLSHRLAAAGVQETQRYSWPRVAPVLAGVYGAAIASARR